MNGFTRGWQVKASATGLEVGPARKGGVGVVAFPADQTRMASKLYARLVMDEAFAYPQLCDETLPGGGATYPALIRSPTFTADLLKRSSKPCRLSALVFVPRPGHSSSVGARKPPRAASTPYIPQFGYLSQWMSMSDVKLS